MSLPGGLVGEPSTPRRALCRCRSSPVSGRRGGSTREGGTVAEVSVDYPELIVVAGRRVVGLGLGYARWQPARAGHQRARHPRRPPPGQQPAAPLALRESAGPSPSTPRDAQGVSHYCWPRRLADRVDRRESAAPSRSRRRTALQTARRPSSARPSPTARTTTNAAILGITCP